MCIFDYLEFISCSIPAFLMFIILIDILTSIRRRRQADNQSQRHRRICRGKYIGIVPRHYSATSHRKDRLHTYTGERYSHCCTSNQHYLDYPGMVAKFELCGKIVRWFEMTVVEGVLQFRSISNPTEFLRQKRCSASAHGTKPKHAPSYNNHLAVVDNQSIKQSCLLAFCCCTRFTQWRRSGSLRWPNTLTVALVTHARGVVHMVLESQSSLRCQLLTIVPNRR